jgi:hypothetical protein
VWDPGKQADRLVNSSECQGQELMATQVTKAHSKLMSNFGVQLPLVAADQAGVPEPLVRPETPQLLKMSAVEARQDFRRFSVKRGAAPSKSRDDERRRSDWEKSKKSVAIFPPVESLSYIPSVVHTGLKVENWKAIFQDYDDPELLKWVEFGFPAQCEVENRSVFAHNHGSFEQFREQSLQGIEEEIVAGRILEFVDGPPCNPLRVNPLGSVPKNRRETMKRRRTSDLSFPMGYAVNEGLVEGSLPDLKFASVGDVVAMIQEMRAAVPDCQIFMCKLDVENAYRNLAVDKNDWWLLGYWVDGRYLVDTRLPFGLVSAPSHFSRVTRAITWAAARAGFKIIGYLDDFLVIECSRERALEARQFLIDLFGKLGLPIQMKKFSEEGEPALEKIFLGILVDTVKGELRLDEDRMQQIKDELSLWRGKRDATVREISQLVGVLAFAAKVVAPGRLYLSRLISLLRNGSGGPIRYSQRRVLSAGALEDVEWWFSVMPVWNGVAIIPPLIPEEAVEWKLETDASGWGYGGHCGPFYFFGPWPAGFVDWDIHFKELAAVVIAFLLFSKRFAGHHLAVKSDNDAAVWVLKRGFSSAPNSDVANHMLRQLHLEQAVAQFSYSAMHIPGVTNVAADALSRNDERAYLVLMSPQVVTRRIVPASLWRRLKKL